MPRSAMAAPVVAVILPFLELLSLEGEVIQWVADHRGWIFQRRCANRERFAYDLLTDRDFARLIWLLERAGWAYDVWWPRPLPRAAATGVDAPG